MTLGTTAGFNLGPMRNFMILMKFKLIHEAEEIGIYILYFNSLYKYLRNKEILTGKSSTSCNLQDQLEESQIFCSSFSPFQSHLFQNLAFSFQLYRICTWLESKIRSINLFSASFTMKIIYLSFRKPQRNFRITKHFKTSYLKLKTTMFS